MTASITPGARLQAHEYKVFATFVTVRSRDLGAYLTFLGASFNSVSVNVYEARPSGAMDLQGKSVGKGGPQGSYQARVDEQTPGDLVALVKELTQHLQVLPDEESSGKSGSAKSGEAKDFPQHVQVLPVEEESSGRSSSAKSGEAKDFPQHVQVLPVDEESGEAKDFPQHVQVLPVDEESSGKSWSAKSGEAKDFPQHVQVLPDDESSGKSGSAKSCEVSAFSTLFQAPSGTKIQPQWQEVDEIYHRMRRILHNPDYMDGERLSHGDEIAVRDVLKYHPNCEKKTGPGIEYIKIQQIFNHHTHCFWVVRVDGTEIDFSYHKCLKGKAAKECPDLLEQYDFLYKFYKPRPARNSAS